VSLSISQVLFSSGVSSIFVVVEFSFGVCEC